MQRKGLDDEQRYNLARNKFCVQTHSVACRRLILLDTLCNLDNVCDTARNWESLQRVESIRSYR